MTETWLSDDTRSSVSGAGRDFAGGDTRVGSSGMTTLDLREGRGVCSSAYATGGLGGNGNEKVARDWRRGTIVDRRRVIVLCTSCGLEILTRTPESLSLRVPFEKPLALSVSRMRNSSLRSGLKSTLSIYHTKKRQLGDANPFMTPMMIQARPIIRKTRRVSITPKLVVANPMAVSMAEILAPITNQPRPRNRMPSHSDAARSSILYCARTQEASRMKNTKNVAAS